MNLLDHFRAMARNNAWSNYRLIKACAALSEGDFRAKRVSFFPSIQLTLHHNLIVDWFYLDVLEEGGRGYGVYRPSEEFATATSIAEAQSATDRRLTDFCDRLTEADLERKVAVPRPTPVPPERIADLLAHLFVHQIHHRGQAHAMLAGTNIPPPQLDEFFLEGDAALNADDLAALKLSRR
jgi:uncharacterized damage-inducible protein DinB